ncbi:MAG: SapC family protein [Pseudohongiellaceae bacterium]
MSSYVPLQNDKHANLKVRASNDFRRFKDQHLIPIVTQDFFRLASEFPLVFVASQKDGNLVPVAMMGLREGVNLYCQEETYPAQFVPLGFTTAPFSLTAADPQGDQFALLIDEESPLVSESEGEALFNEKGERTAYLQERLDAIEQVSQQSNQTRAICKLLKDLDLLKTQQLQLRIGPDATSFNIDGIYTVDEKALNDLSDEQFLELRKQGLIALIYAHLTSLQQVRRILMKQDEWDRTRPTA